jgi:hypothetical protein
MKREKIKFLVPLRLNRVEQETPLCGAQNIGLMDDQGLGVLIICSEMLKHLTLSISYKL